MDMSLTATILEKTTLSEQVKTYILNLITEQKLNPGTEVPSEKQLIETLGVSRGVIREAFQSLSTLGVLDISSGKRPRVQTVNPTALGTIFHYSMATRQVSASQILELRCALEVNCAGLAAIHGTEQDFEQLREEMKQIRISFGNHQQFIIHDARFHLILASATNNPLYSLLLQALRASLEESIAAGLQAQDSQKHAEQIVDFHQQITDCVCARDAEGARKMMQAHFDSAINALINSAKI